MLELCISQDATLRETLQNIGATAQGIAFAVDANGRLTGVVTDGDIRRALLANATLETRLIEVMQRDYVALPVETPPEDIHRHLNSKITHIPLLDKSGVPTDYASLGRLHRIPVCEPSLSGNEVAYLLKAIGTNWISSQGQFVKQFEEVFSAYHAGVPALSVSNGTAALHLALVALGIGPGDEVIVPNLTFAASANTVIHAGGVPVLVDVDPHTWTLDPAQLSRALTPRTRAIMPVHLYGHPCDMDPIMRFAREHKLLVVEDCAEGLGALYRGQPVGTFGDAGCFSFFSNKLITTGEGGMILFKDSKRFDHAKRLRDHGMDPLKRYWHTEIGFNYRLTNLQAAIGVAQMEQIDSFVNRKLALAEEYREALRSFKGIQFPESASWARNIYWLYTVRVDPALGISRDELMYGMVKNGVETRPFFYLLSDMPIYKKYGGGREFPVSAAVSASGMSLPSAVSLTSEEIQRVAKELSKAIGIKQLSQKAG